MSGTQPVQRIAEQLIRVSCRRLPADERAEHYKEWSAEVPAILCDTSVRLPMLRAVRALRYSAGISRTTRYLCRTGSGVRRPSTWRDGAIRVRPGTALRLVIGVAIWLVVVLAVVSLVRAFPQPPVWPLVVGLTLAAAFDASCLVDIARAQQVRFLPKWAWALICLTQVPGGGIVYICVGRHRRGRPARPRSAQLP